MFQAISEWIFHRALRLSTAAVTLIAARTGQKPARVTALNDAVAAMATNEAVRLALRAAPAVREGANANGDR